MGVLADEAFGEYAARQFLELLGFDRLQ